MIKKLVVGGCSIAHGCELYNDFMHPNNVAKSFSSYLARHLNLELHNIALSGASNEHIFLSCMETVTQLKNIDSIIVSWTSIQRLSWKNKNRHWFFIPSFAASVNQLPDGTFETFIRNVEYDGAWCNSDNVEDIDTLKTQYRFFVNNYLDDFKVLLNKLKIYRLALQAFCKDRNVRLIEVTPFELPLSVYRYGKELSWVKEKRHPNEQEHEIIAHEILNKFYCSTDIDK